jgi:hypothetical protein
MFGILKSIPEDRTFAQLRGFPQSKDVKFGDNNYHSKDLSSATDRFPIGFQVLVLELLYGSDYSQA